MSDKSVPTEAEYEATKSYFDDLRRQHAEGTLGPEKIAIVEKQFPAFDWTAFPQDLRFIAPTGFSASVSGLSLMVTDQRRSYVGVRTEPDADRAPKHGENPRCRDLIHH